MSGGRKYYPPPADFAMSQLCQWHVVSAVCGACQSWTIFRHARLLSLNSRYRLLLDLEPKLRCRKCDNRKGNRLFLRIAERD